MTAPFHMLRLEPDMARLARWAHAQELVGHAGDLGYALHAALAAAFGEDTPRPFRLTEIKSRNGHPARPAVLGYVDTDKNRLRAHAADTPPDIAGALRLDRLDTKAMPGTWPTGARFHFELRARPVVRTDGEAGRGSVRERDAFLHACDDAGEGAVDRAAVYADWLARQFERSGGARLLADAEGRPGVSLDAFQRLRIARRGTGRKLREVEGPDAILSGMLEVTQGDAFARLLRRGVGRHRAFGYGMLLLKPARKTG